MCCIAIASSVSLALPSRSSRRAGAARALDKVADKWVEDTFKKMTLDDKVGQLIVSAIDSTYLVERHRRVRARSRRRSRRCSSAAFHVFGGASASPPLLLDNAPGAVILGQPFAAASLLNRLQALSALPLLNTADFEAGVGFRIQGATVFPRADGGRRGRRRAARVRGRAHHGAGGARDRRARQLLAGRRRQQQPAQSRHQHALVRRSRPTPSASSRRPTSAASTRAACWRRSSIFPGHGDTDVDSHLGLPIINQPRERLDAVELPPFQAGHRVPAPTRS